MILANLTRAIRQQNWFAVAVEFLIVIAGVVIGFQITEWNEARTARELEEEYLLRIHTEIRCSLSGQRFHGIGISGRHPAYDHRSPGHDTGQHSIEPFL